MPEFDKTDPLEDLKDYTDQCGGNGELVYEHFAAQPPPPLSVCSRRRPVLIERDI